MKNIYTILIGLLLPSLLFCQLPAQYPNDQILLNKSTLREIHGNPLYHKLMTTYKATAQLHKKVESPSMAPLAVKQILDSIISIPVDTTIAAHKSAYIYNMNGNITSSADYDWDSPSKTWFYTTKIDWSYNTSHYNIEYITYYGDHQTWYNDQKFENTFDQYGRLINVLGYGWTDSTSTWNKGFKIDNTFDGIGRLITAIASEYVSTNDTWNPLTKTEYDYDNGVADLVITDSEWQSTLWVLTEKREIDFDVFGKERNYTHYQWDGSGDWANFDQTKSQTNANDQYTNITDFLWDVISVIWVNSKKVDYAYDFNNNMTQSVFRKYVKQLQGFILDSKEDCLYNNQYTYDDLLLPPDLKFTLNVPRFTDNDIYFSHMITKYTYSIHDGTKYVANNSKTFYYSPKVITKSIDYNSISAINVIPNPAKSYFTIVTDDNTSREFSLFDISGKLKFTKKINSNEMISTESLPKGMYLYKIIDNQKSLQTGKLVIE